MAKDKVKQETAGTQPAEGRKKIGVIEVSAKTGKSDRVVKSTYNFGENLEDAVKRFGDDVVFSKFQQSAIIDLQSVQRRLIIAGKSDAEIQQIVSQWRPGVSTAVKLSPRERAVSYMKSLTPEERKAILSQFE